MKNVFLFVSACLISTFSYAVHIVGGSINMKLIKQNGNNLTYEITASMILDETTLSFGNGVQTGNYDTQISISMFSISDKSHVQSFTLYPDGSRTGVVYKNAACARQRNLRFSESIYLANYSFTANLYDDPLGYRLVWERCCRSSNLSNIGNLVGMVFYLVIPPMYKNGQPFLNSTPTYLIPNGDYICINRPFKMQFDAFDADKDELIYSLDNPLAGYATSGNPSPSGIIWREKYPSVPWLTGFNAKNPIPGKPTLDIDSKTGLLTIIGTEAGLYVFSVKCEEYRNGVKIGETHRDFQLPVVECPIQTPPQPSVLDQFDSPIMADVPLCDGQPVILKTNADYAWAHQWQKDGDNIANATTNQIQVTVPGTYSVIRSFADLCSSDTMSKIIKVVPKTVPKAKITATKKQFCDGDSVRLASNGSINTISSWTLDNQNTGTGLQINAFKAGTYILVVKYTDGCSSKDTTKLTLLPKPESTISGSSAALCDNDSVQLMANVGTNLKYEWYRNNTILTNRKSNKFYTKADGEYKVKITDGNGCINNSLNWVIKISHTDVVLDSISPICGGSKDVIKLNGLPTGGTYVGTGVSEAMFDPKIVQPGRYTVTYTYINADKCSNSAKRIIAIDAQPQITFTNEVMRINPGQSVKLDNSVTPQNVGYLWSPVASLNNATIPIPTASPTENTSYLLLVTTTNGCQARARMSVLLGEVPYIPDAFTPNGDGANDLWVIPNAALFPDIKIRIFNRWGDVIYYTEGYTMPWDGFFKNQKVTTGAYAYQVSYGGSVPGFIRGTVWVLY